MTIYSHIQVHKQGTNTMEPYYKYLIFIIGFAIMIYLIPTAKVMVHITKWFLEATIIKEILCGSVIIVVFTIITGSIFIYKKYSQRKVDEEIPAEVINEGLSLNAINDRILVLINEADNRIHGV